MERQDIVLTSVLVVLTGLLGFYVALQTSGDTDDRFTNYTADSENGVATASFYDRTIDLMYEDSQAARMYLDLDRDGSFDRELDLARDGEYHTLTELVELEGEGYVLHIRYRDSANQTGDGEMTLYRVTKP